MMTQLVNVKHGETLLYTAMTHTVGGRQHGAARSSDGNLDVRLALPGSGRPGTNPEQLLAAGWSACFESAIGIAARRQRIRLTSDPTIDAEVDLNQGDDGYFLRARLNIHLPGLDLELAQALLREARETCPYSKAMQGNIDVHIGLV
jgi:lipoyl-dependent peroxiredoxin